MNVIPKNSIWINVIAQKFNFDECYRKNSILMNVIAKIQF